MRIIYGYSNCTDTTYNRIVSERNVQTMVPDQKYHGLLIKGLAKNGAEVRCFSGLPVNRAVTARKLVREPDEQEGNAYFHYITTINFPVIRQLMVFFGAFFGMMRIKKDNETYAVCDFLNIAVAAALILACKLRRIKKTAVVTDIPDMFNSGRMRKAVRNFVMRRFDGYVLLTEYMREFIPQDAPYIVLEGHVDSEAPHPASGRCEEAETGKRVVIYAGNIQTRYGIRYLVEGFLKADVPGAELRVFGRGDYEEELKKLCERYPCVQYRGLKPNSEVVAEEQRASLLVNPRPTSEAYTKYSFPSKNMEYLVSGTPMLTTRLPGMPSEYEPYVWFIGDETPEGAADALNRFFSVPLEERLQKAQSAREFVLRHKSNVVQAKRIIDFLNQQK